MIAVDIRRNVKARNVKIFAEDGGCEEGALDAAMPGDVQRVSPDRIMFPCPGCGKWGGVRATPPPKVQKAWVIEKGDLDDATTLTLSPSIHCVGCCGWHGYLTEGEFRSC